MDLQQHFETKAAIDAHFPNDDHRDGDFKKVDHSRGTVWAAPTGAKVIAKSNGTYEIDGDDHFKKWFNNHLAVMMHYLELTVPLLDMKDAAFVFDVELICLRTHDGIKAVPQSYLYSLKPAVEIEYNNVKLTQTVAGLVMTVFATQYAFRNGIEIIDPWVMPDYDIRSQYAQQFHRNYLLTGKHIDAGWRALD